MKRQDIISSIVTFVVGAVVGSYLYLYGFAPQFKTLIDSAGSSGQLVIVGEAYGGCSRGSICTSFQVANDGSFRTFPTVAIGAERKVKTGQVSADLYKELRTALSKDALIALSKPVAGSNCSSYGDGVDYRLRVTAGDEQFVLDTCTTALANERDMSLLFSDMNEEINI